LFGMTQLYDDMKQAFHESSRSQYAVHLLDAIYIHHTFRTSDLAEQLYQEFEIHKNTSSDLLQKLRRGGLLKELQPASGQRPAVLCLPQLVNIAEGRVVV